MEYTSKRILAIAAKGIQTGELTKAEIKAVCASALTQARNQIRQEPIKWPRR